jgi:hypothetical protein
VILKLASELGDQLRPLLRLVSGDRVEIPRLVVVYIKYYQRTRKVAA